MKKLMPRLNLALLREVRVGEIDVAAEDGMHARREASYDTYLNLMPAVFAIAAGRYGWWSWEWRPR